eukprot:scaffold757_cov168-Amphora_coffeaeformis.AAC.7
MERAGSLITVARGTKRLGLKVSGEIRAVTMLFFFDDDDDVDVDVDVDDDGERELITTRGERQSIRGKKKKTRERLDSCCFLLTFCF